LSPLTKKAISTSAMTRARKRDQRLPRVAVDRAVMWHSELIPRDIERTVEDAKNIDVSVALQEVGDSVMSVEQYANVSRRCTRRCLRATVELRQSTL